LYYTSLHGVFAGYTNLTFLDDDYWKRLKEVETHDIQKSHESSPSGH